MKQPPPPTVEPAAPSATPHVYHVGTLAYTKAGMLTLFAWLLWGDFVFNFMEIVIGSFLPLKLKDLGASDWTLSLVLSTLPSLLGMATGPFYSVASDRTRTRFGRRIPYLLFTTPIVTLLLVAIGMSDTLGLVIHRFISPSVAPVVTTLWLVVIIVPVFSLFNGFMMAAYNNLLNDVVPPEVIARFLAMFRIVCIIATSLFQFYFFGLAKTHMAPLIVGSGILYGVMFMAMALAVKEGEYPPPAHDPQAGKKWINHAKVYIKESFCVKVYWYHFIVATFWSISFIVTTYRVFFAQSVGLDLDQFGKLMGVAGIVSALLIYPAGALGDRWHPVRTMALGLVLLLLVVPLQLVFVLFDIPQAFGAKLYMALFVLHISVQAMVNASLMPLQMKIYPRDRFAQIGSAGGIVQALGGIFGGMIAGLWLDWLKGHETVALFHYRYYPAWVSGSHIVCLIFTLLLYREWKRLGGDDHYTAP